MDVRKRFEFSAFFSVLFAFAASGYRYLSLGYSGDSTMIYEGGDWLYQISLGRFLQPLYWMLRGRIVAPYSTIALSRKKRAGGAGTGMVFVPEGSRA